MEISKEIDKKATGQLRKSIDLLKAYSCRAGDIKNEEDIVLPLSFAIIILETAFNKVEQQEAKKK